MIWAFVLFVSFVAGGFIGISFRGRLSLFLWWARGLNTLLQIISNAEFMMLFDLLLSKVVVTRLMLVFSFFLQNLLFIASLIRKDAYCRTSPLLYEHRVSDPTPTEIAKAQEVIQSFPNLTNWSLPSHSSFHHPTAVHKSFWRPSVVLFLYI